MMERRECGMEERMRLDRYLSEMGRGTRSEIRQWIRQGRIRVNGITAADPGIRILTGEDTVEQDGAPVIYEKYEYYMLNKPSGVVSATEDRRDMTVISLIGESRRKDLFPVGRLDKDTEGLLIITNDGELAHRLLSPKRHVDKVYYARVRGTVTQDEIRLFEEGIRVDEEFTAMPARLAVTEADGGISEILITIREGKFHQVKRMFEAVGMKVLYLKRLQMGPVTLDAALAPGEYRRLTEEEIQALKEAAGAGTSLPPHAERGVPRGNEEYHEMSDSREE